MGRIVIGPVRLSYAWLFKMSKFGKFGANILIPKTDQATMGVLWQAYQTAIAEAMADPIKASHFTKTPPGSPKFEYPFKDGDVEKPGDPVYAGHWFLNAKTTTQPEVINTAGEPLTTDAQCGSGDYCKVSIGFFAFTPNAKKEASATGVGVELGNVMKTADGERLGGGDYTKASDEFGVAAAPALGFAGFGAPSQQGGFPAQQPAPQGFPQQAPQPAGFPAQAPAYPPQQQPAPQFPAQPAPMPYQQPAPGQPYAQPGFPQQPAPQFPAPGQAPHVPTPAYPPQGFPQQAPQPGYGQQQPGYDPFRQG